MATGTSNQMGSAQEAGRPQPQTTVEASGGPFIRHSQPGRAPQYVVSGTTPGGVITQPLVARPGYFRNLRVTHTVSGSTGTPTLTPDTPYNLNSLVQCKDAFGTPLIVAPGFEASNVIPTFSGGFGLGISGTESPSTLPSYNAISATGNGSFSYALPLEFAKGYGVLSAANASLLPTLQFNTNASFLTSGTGTPVIQTQVDSDFYWLPEGVAVEPPGLGTTRQWILQQANPTISSASSVRVQFPRLGGYLDTIAVIFRSGVTETAAISNRNSGIFPGFAQTSSNAGTTGLGRIQLYVDGVPMVDSTTLEWLDDMAIQYGLSPTQLGVTGGTFTNSASTGGAYNYSGILAISRKTSLNQVNLGLLDTGEAYLSTNPGTLLELNMAPAGTITAGSPVTANVMVGQIVPTGSIIQGLPEV